MGASGKLRATSPVALSLLVASLGAAGCGAPAAEPDAPSRAQGPATRPDLGARGGPATGRAADGGSLEATRLRLAPLERRPGARAGGARRALLVVADEYARPAWRLSEGREAARRLQAALTGGLRLPDDAVTLLQGADVTPTRIKRAIAAAAAPLQGSGNLLLVYYYGHGLVRDGALNLFTYDTDLRADRLEAALPYAELQAAVAEARQGARGRGAELQVVTVVDACRTGQMGLAGVAPWDEEDAGGAPGPVAAEEGVFSLSAAPVADVEVFSASPGQPAQEGVFAAAFCEALGEAARRDRVELGAVVEQAARTIAEQGEPQRPMRRGAAELVLHRTGSLALTVEVYDQEGGREVEGAEVRLNALHASSPASFRGLGPGSYFLQVRHSAYFWRDEDVELTARDAGAVLRVGLLPRTVRIEGELINPHGTVARVRLAGADPAGSIAGYHRLAADVAGSGRFRLELPAAPTDAELVISVAGQVLARRALARASVGHLTLDAGGARPLRLLRYDLGAIDLGEAARARRVEDLGAGVTVGSVVLPGDLRFVDAARALVYERAQQQLTRGGLDDFRIGLRALESLGPDACADAATRAAVAALVPRVRLQYLVRLREREPGPARAALEQALARGELTGAHEPTARAELVRWLAADAARAEAAGDLAGALRLVDQALASTPAPEARAVLEARRVELWVAQVRRAIDRALEDDGWLVASAIVNKAVQALGAEQPALAEERARLGREAMPRVGRERVRAGDELYADGRLEEAEAAYEAALPQANAHYGARIEAQLADLRRRLFVKYYALADDRLAGGDRRGALEAFLRAYRYEPDVVRAVLSEFPHADPRWRPLYERAGLPDGPPTREERLWREAQDRRRRALGAPEVPGFTFLGGETFSCGGRAYEVAVYRCERFAQALGVAPGARDPACEFVLVPGGSFRMGSVADPAEQPVREVEVGAFLLARTEVTQRVWQALLGTTPSYFPGDRRPVEQVTWHDALELCAAVPGLRLPSEAEWEYAARAGSTAEYTFGGEQDAGRLADYAWFSENSGGATHPVAGRRANAFGLFDVHGNVWEWCADGYAASYQGAPGDGSAWQPEGASARVARGGGWADDITLSRVTIRSGDDPARRLRGLGFRPARSLP